MLKTIREAFKKRPKCNVAVMMTTRGPEVLLGKLKDKKEIVLETDDTIEITNEDIEGDKTKISCNLENLVECINIGAKIALGTVTMEVVEVKASSVIAKVTSGGTFGEKKIMHFPFTEIGLPSLTEQDEQDILKFALKEGIDLIAMSGVRKADDINDLRDFLGPRGAHIKIIAKIGNYEAIINYEKILDVSDGILIARGELGMYLPVEKVFLAQKFMIDKANLAGKPIITATQMMDSMVRNPHPTRAEATDVANAVLDGTDCVLLSTETSQGRFPVQSVEIAARVNINLN